MYNGDEKIVSDGTYTPHTMLDFWKWAYSNIHYNMQRGTFADFLVRCALEDGGFPTRPEIGTGFEPYDLEGPIIPVTGNYSRIEVKSAAVLQTWGLSNRIAFSIAPARVQENGDYKHNSPQQRNNDLFPTTLLLTCAVRLPWVILESYIPRLMIKYIAMLVFVFLMVVPLGLACLNYACGVFDECINKVNYPQIYKKGLRKENGGNEQ